MDLYESTRQTPYYQTFDAAFEAAREASQREQPEPDGDLFYFRMTSNYTYAEYLAKWEEHFGDETEGMYHYYFRGNERPAKMRLLSEDEFEKAKSAINYYSAAFDKYLANNDDEGMEQALARSFPFELMLFI